MRFALNPPTRHYDDLKIIIFKKNKAHPDDLGAIKAVIKYNILVFLIPLFIVLLCSGVYLGLRYIPNKFKKNYYYLCGLAIIPLSLLRLSGRPYGSWNKVIIYDHGILLKGLFRSVIFYYTDIISITPFLKKSMFVKNRYYGYTFNLDNGKKYQICSDSFKHVDVAIDEIIKDDQYIDKILKYGEIGI